MQSGATTPMAAGSLPELRTPVACRAEPHAPVPGISALRSAGPGRTAAWPWAVRVRGGARPAGGAMAARASSATAETGVQDFTWQGSDEYTSLGDRQDRAPLPLPQLSRPKRVVLVRHGQSTWNAEGRVQGSTDFSELTPKGVAQAETTRELLQNDRFDTLIHSPLQRAAKTASIIWGSRAGRVIEMASLREIDLYSFQGLLKGEGKARFGEQFSKWQRQAAEFEIDGHAPIRELWFRASLAWQEVLGQEELSSGLLVAHNAVNQALVATAVGFPPTAFRRLLQSNGATTVLDFTPVPGQPPSVTINRLNQSPGPPFGQEAFVRPGAGRLVLVRAGATEGQEGRLLGRSSQGLSTLGMVQAQKAAELLMDVQVGAVVSSPLARATDTARPLADLQSLAGRPKPPVRVEELLNDRHWGSLQGRLAQEVRQQERSDSDAEQLPAFRSRIRQAVGRLCELAHAGGGQTVAVVAHSAVISGALCHCLGLPEAEDSLSLFRTDAGSVTVVDLPDPEAPNHGVVRCINYTAHLGRWAIPVTREDLNSELTCGIDGCF